MAVPSEKKSVAENGPTRRRFTITDAQLANTSWRALAEELGFRWDTVVPVAGQPENVFSAIPKDVSEPAPSTAADSLNASGVEPPARGDLREERANENSGPETDVDVSRAPSASGHEAKRSMFRYLADIRCDDCGFWREQYADEPEIIAAAIEEWLEEHGNCRPVPKLSVSVVSPCEDKLPVNGQSPEPSVTTPRESAQADQSNANADEPAGSAALRPSPEEHLRCAQPECGELRSSPLHECDDLCERNHEPRLTCHPFIDPVATPQSSPEERCAWLGCGLRCGLPKDNYAHQCVSIQPHKPTHACHPFIDPRSVAPSTPSSPSSSPTETPEPGVDGSGVPPAGETKYAKCSNCGSGDLRVANVVGGCCKADEFVELWQKIGCLDCGQDNGIASDCNGRWLLRHREPQPPENATNWQAEASRGWGRAISLESTNAMMSVRIASLESQVILSQMQVHGEIVAGMSETIREKDEEIARLRNSLALINAALKRPDVLAAFRDPRSVVVSVRTEDDTKASAIGEYALHDSDLEAVVEDKYLYSLFAWCVTVALGGGVVMEPES